MCHAAYLTYSHSKTLGNILVLACGLSGRLWLREAVNRPLLLALCRRCYMRLTVHPGERLLEPSHQASQLDPEGVASICTRELDLKESEQ